jgi:hypothetical protein
MAWYKFIDGLGEHTISIFRVNLKTDAVGSSKTSINLYQITSLHTTEYDNLRCHDRENVKSFMR